MWIRHLTLTAVRNFQRQELDPPRGASLLLGDNAQGKSNLLEAIFFLATTRSERAQTDGELIHWGVLQDPQPVARLTADVERRDGPLQLEVTVAARQRNDAPRKGDRIAASKRLRVNGVAKRQIDFAGQLTAVLFTTDDMQLISGSPAGRRRFLDTALSQIDTGYARALQQYGKVVTQRNALLKRIQEGGSNPEELDFWDDELSREGAVLVRGRATAVAEIASHALAEHRRISDGEEELSVAYQPRLGDWDGGRAASASPEELSSALREALALGRGRDIGSGMTLTGPHRDDLTFAINGTPAASFASRGQQRTAALSLRLAEARFLADRKGDLPVVLLDDVLSELDEGRRRAVLASLGGWDQIFITSADGDRFGEGLPGDATIFHVRAGTITAG